MAALPVRKGVAVGSAVIMRGRNEDVFAGHIGHPCPHTVAQYGGETQQVQTDKRQLQLTALQHHGSRSQLAPLLRCRRRGAEPTRKRQPGLGRDDADRSSHPQGQLLCRSRSQAGNQQRHDEYTGRQGRRPNRCSCTGMRTRFRWSLEFVKKFTILDISRADTSPLRDGTVCNCHGVKPFSGLWSQSPTSGGSMRQSRPQTDNPQIKTGRTRSAPHPDQQTQEQDRDQEYRAKDDQPREHGDSEDGQPLSELQQGLERSLESD